MTVSVFDSSAVLAIVFDEPGADRALERLDGGLISSVNYSEALAKMIQKGFAAADAIEGLAAMTLQLMPFDKAQAEETAQLRESTAHKGLSIGDRACLALAASRQAVAITTDRAWADLALGMQIEIIR